MADDVGNQLELEPKPQPEIMVRGSHVVDLVTVMEGLREKGLEGQADRVKEAVVDGLIQFQERGGFEAVGDTGSGEKIYQGGDRE